MTTRGDVRSLTSLLSAGAADDLRQQTVANPASIGTTVKAGALLADDADLYLKGMLTDTVRTPGTTNLQLAQTGEEFILTGDLSQLAVGQIVRANGGALRIASVEAGLAKAEAIMPPVTLNTLTPGTWDILSFSHAEADRRIDDRQVVLLEALRDKGVIEKHFAWRFFTSGDSREPELAGLRGAIFGSLLTLIMTLSLSVPLGIAAAVYLEEFARQEQMDGNHRGQHQQSGRRSLDHLRPAWPCGLHQFLRPAAFGSAGGRACAGASGFANHHHRLARRAEGRAALHQGSGPGSWRLAPAGRVPPCAAAGACPAS